MKTDVGQFDCDKTCYTCTNCNTFPSNLFPPPEPVADSQLTRALTSESGPGQAKVWSNVWVWYWKRVLQIYHLEIYTNLIKENIGNTPCLRLMINWEWSAMHFLIKQSVLCSLNCIFLITLFCIYISQYCMCFSYILKFKESSLNN